MVQISTVNIRPGVSILTVLPHLNYKPWFALAEFVDNALQSFLTSRADLEAKEGKAFVLQVDINLDPNRGAITIRDNAAGIAASEFPRAFRPAEIPPDATGLSEFGMGMKSAACWFAPRWSVRTKALGETEERTVNFDIAKIVKDSLEELDVARKPAPRDRHYTEILLHDVRTIPQRRTIGKIKDHLTSIYRCFTREGTLRLSFDGELLAFEAPDILKAPYYKTPKKAPVTWKKRVSLKLSGKRSVEGFVAIREKGSTARAGLALFRRKRLIIGSADETYRPQEIFGAANSFVYQRLFGELHVTGFAVSHTKDGLRWEDTEEEFVRELRKALQTSDMPIIDQANNYRAKGIQKDHKENAERALGHFGEDIEQDFAEQLGQALEEIERTPSEPAAAVPGAKPFKLTGEEVLKTFTLPYNGQEWQVKIVLSYDDVSRSWYEITDFAEDVKKAPRQLGIRLSMTHPFMDLYCDGSPLQTEALVRIAVCLALAETVARDSGQKFAGIVRTNFNELLRLAFSGK
jgi:histidine kinase/DNA gyrase B/HSP90-like ATPase